MPDITYDQFLTASTLVSLRQKGVGPNKTCADALLPKGHFNLFEIPPDIFGKNMGETTEEE